MPGKPFKGKSGTIYVRNVSQSTRDRFHAACSFRGEYMREVIIRMMKEYADKFDRHRVKLANKRKLTESRQIAKHTKPDI